jgi:predicted dehydrogenase
VTGARVRVGVVGCGLIGTRHLEAWQTVARASGLVEIAAVCDQDVQAAHRAADLVAGRRARRPRVHQRVEALLEQDLDAVDICLPTAQHRPVACAALAVGRHVLVEKPLATTIADGRLMELAAQRSGTVLALAENHRRNVSVRTARWLVREEDLLGTPYLLHVQRSRYQHPSEAEGAWQWRASRVLSGGGWALDNGAHLLDTLIYVLGPVATVAARTDRTQERMLTLPDGTVRADEREDLLAAMFVFESGTTGLISSAGGLPYADDFGFALRGSWGAIVDRTSGQLFHPLLPGAKVHTPAGEIPLESWIPTYLAQLGEERAEDLFPWGLRDDFALELADFLRAVTTGREPEVGVAAALDTLATSLAFYESAIAAGATVAVADVLDGTAHLYQDTLLPDDSHGDVSTVPPSPEPLPSPSATGVAHVR